MGRAARPLRAVPMADGPVATGEGGPAGSERWERMLATGDRAALLPGTLRAIIAEAGRDGRLQDEIGRLRVAADRLLAEVTDAARLAALLPPVVNAIVRAIQAQRALGGDDDEELVRLIERVLALRDEEEQGQTTRHPREGGDDDDR